MDRSTWRVLGVANGDGVEGLESQRAAEVVLDAIGRLWDFKGRVAAQGGGYVVVVEVAPDIDGAEQWGELRAIVEIVNRYGADAAERFFNFDAAPIVAAA